jgi:hypothetical protein
LEQIGHEEEALKVLSALEAEGWMKVLYPAWTPAKADEERMTALHDLAVELLMQGVHPDMSAAQMRLLTARLTPKELAALKKLMLRPGFVEEWDSLDTLAAGFAKKLLAKDNAIPSAGFKLFMSYDPEAILWLGFTSKDAAVKERFNLFLKVWPEVRQHIPHALMQEMRITAELPAYKAIVEAVFLELLDGKLATPEEARAYLEPHSPPAPPPQVTIKRPRAKRGAEAKLKEQSFDDEEESEDALDEDEDLDDIGGDDDDLDLGLHLPKVELDVDNADDAEVVLTDDEDLDEDEDDEMTAKPAPEPAPAKRAPKQPAQSVMAPAPAKKTGEKQSALKPEKAEKPAEPAKAKPAPAASKPQPASAKAAAVEAKKPVQKAAAAPIKTPAKAPVKAVQKPAAKSAAKPLLKSPAKVQPKASASRPVAAKKKPAHAASSKPVKAAKPGGKKQAAKPAKKR